MGRGTRWKGTTGDHKGPPSRSPPPSPLRNDEHVSNKPTRVRARGAGKDPATLFPRQLERVPVTLSAAKGLGSWAARSFAALRMTARAPLKSAHGKPYLRMSISFQRVMSNDILVYADLELYIDNIIDKYTCQ